jgi:hypothetical protein
VEGVRGTLVLGLDGGETLSLTQAGRFTFTAKRPKGGAYAVSVATAPQGQRCTVTNGSGTVAGNVEGISVRCHDWFDLVSTQAARVVIGQTDFDTSVPQPGPGRHHGRRHPQWAQGQSGVRQRPALRLGPELQPRPRLHGHPRGG